MDRNLIRPAFGAVLLAAAAFGVHIGQSAIDQINPLHFQGPAVHPRDRGAAVAEADFAPEGPRFSDLYGWEEGRSARGADCRDCDALAARDAHGARLAMIRTGWSGAPEPAAIRIEPESGPAPEPSEEAPEAAWAEIDRYTDFEIEQARGGKSGDEPIAVAALQE